MRRAEPSRHQPLHRQVGKLLLRIPEESLCLPVGENDTPIGLRGDDGIRGPLDETLQEGAW